MATIFTPAVIAAASALMIAILSAWLARRNSRDVEILKAALVGGEVDRGLLRDETRKILAHIDTLISDIQRLRDAMLILAGNSVLAAAYETFENRSVELARNFAAAAASLTEHDSDLAHNAKRIAMELQLQLESAVGSGRLSEELKIQLRTARADLHELQSDLRDARMRALLQVASGRGVVAPRLQ